MYYYYYKCCYYYYYYYYYYYASNPLSALPPAGRLCEMFEDAECVSFQDMSRLRFLVVDEADRIMEDGHYPEVGTVLVVLYGT